MLRCSDSFGLVTELLHMAVLGRPYCSHVQQQGCPKTSLTGWCAIRFVAFHASASGCSNVESTNAPCHSACLGFHIGGVADTCGNVHAHLYCGRVISPDLSAAVMTMYQANQRILDSAANRLGIPAEKVVSNLSSYGEQLSAASIPIAFSEAVQKGMIKKGDKVPPPPPLSSLLGCTTTSGIHDPHTSYLKHRTCA